MKINTINKEIKLEIGDFGIRKIININPFELYNINRIPDGIVILVLKINEKYIKYFKNNFSLIKSIILDGLTYNPYNIVSIRNAHRPNRLFLSLTLSLANN